jgi:uncharacterized membrane protein YphA (DoxX/SURF4 family)
MNAYTRIFLVLLRLAIGWHFLVEGVEKVQSVMTGETVTNRPWTSEGYLREASGPLLGVLRQQFGDPDEAALERLTVAPLPPGQDSSRVPAGTRILPALAQDWQAYLDRFAAHYRLSPQQRDMAQTKLDQSKEKAVGWLLGQRGAQEVKKTFPSGTVAVKETPPERIAEYKLKLAQLHDLESREMPAFERDVGKQRLRALKADVARLRTDLLNDLNRPMREALQSVLTDEQKKNPLPETAPPHWWKWTHAGWTRAFAAWGAIMVGTFLMLSTLGQLAASQACSASRLGGGEWALVALLAVVAAAAVSGFLAWQVRQWPGWDWPSRGRWLALWLAAFLGAGLLVSLLAQVLCHSRDCATWGGGQWLLAWLVALLGAGVALGLAWYVARYWSDWSQQEVIDWLVTFGLCAVGACLLLGFLTRPACLAGALLLLMFYLAMPAVPGVPDNPRAEGHYLYINKNIIEMLALLALATTRSGRWLGLDGLVPLFNPVRWFPRTAEDVDSRKNHTPSRRAYSHGR